MNKTSQNTKVESLFSEVMKAYDKTSIFKYKSASIIFIFSQIINIVHLILIFLTKVSNLTLSDKCSNIMLYISCILMYVSVLIYDRKIRKAFNDKVGSNYNNISTTDSFILDSAHFTDFDINKTIEICKIKLKKMSPNKKIIKPINIIHNILLPIITGLIIAYHSIEHHSSILSFDLIYTLMWILFFSLLYDVIEKICNRNYYKIENLLTHLELTIIERNL